MTQQRQAVEQLFVGNSEMAMLMRSHDWSQTPLGPISGWTSSLKIAVSICLNSRFPMVIWWGKELVLLYNDAWQPILGTKHPTALGRPGQEVWSEIWDIVGVQLNSVLETAQATWSEDMLLLVDRYGYTEETYFTYSYSPIFLETGEVGGAFTAVTETTRRIIGERRLSTLRELAASTVEAKSVEETCRIASATLANNLFDIPFALLYLVEQDGEQARLVETVRVDAGTPASPEQIDLTQEQDDWQLALVRKSGNPEIVDDLITRFGALSGGAWEEPCRSAIALPIAQPGQKPQIAGFLILGISPRLGFDDEYRGFFDLLVSNVTTAIANAQAYEEERKRAEALAELDRAKTAFFSNVSHEFRTPLTLMLSPLEELSHTLDERLETDEREQIQLIQRNGLRLQKLVNTLLDFSRLEAGRVQATFEPTDLAAFTAELASVFRSTIERANLRLVVDCPPLPEWVYVDREMWEKIVLNLLSNAFKFTFEGKISVQLQALADAVQLKVQDTGIGIPAAELPNLFERFHRVKGAQGRSFEGSGIGLSLVQELVKLHQGTITVTSVEGEGTCLTIAIPTGTAHLSAALISTSKDDRSSMARMVSTIAEANFFVEEASRWLPENAQLSSSESNSEAPIPASNLTQTSQTARILLADDNADMREYVKRLLSQRYEVEAVPDGVAALDAIRRSHPNLLLTDVMMPGLDGFELLRSLRTDLKTQQIPIILLSARAGEEARVEGLEAGADDYLTKPFSARELLARVESTLKLAQLRQESADREYALQAETEAVRVRLEMVLAGIDDHFVVLDRHWHITYINAQGAAAMGMPGEELLDQNFWNLFPDLVGSEFYDRLHQVMHDRIPMQFEYYYSIWDTWFENRLYPAPDGGIVNLCSSITERKRVELNDHFLNQLDAQLRQLSTADEMLSAVMNQVGEYLNVDRCIWHDIDPEQGLAIVEQDWQRQEIPSSSGIYQLSDFILPELLVQYQAGQSLVVSDRTTNPYIAPLEANYALYDIRAMIAAPCLFEGRWVALLVVSTRTVRHWRPDEVLLLQEITARLWSMISYTHAVGELRQSEAEMRHLANAMPQIVWISGADGALEFVNDRWTEYTGLTLEQSRNQALMAQVIPGEDQERLTADFTQAQQTRSPYQSEFRLIQADGSFRYFLTRAIPVQNESSQVQKWYGTSTDITELKQLEVQRSQLLAQEQTARETAETANRIKDEFLAVLSHELRSPLNPILGWSKLLQSRKLDEAKTVQALATIERNAKLQSELIEDLLDVSRILQGKLSLNVSSVNLAATVQAAIETVRLAAEAKLIRIETNLLDFPIRQPAIGQLAIGQPAIEQLSTKDPATVQVLGDSTRLQQVVWNLLSNAVKFTPTGGRVTVRLEPIADQVHIIVKDTGKGIPANFLPYVFDYFRQEDGKTTRQFGGLGLGLAIVRHLVELHGGIVKADSPGEGLGTTFTVKLPLMDVHSTVTLDRLPAEPSLDLHDVQVLVIDDETDSREFVAFVLEQAGARVLTATSASEGLAMLTQSVLTQSLPDVVLSDIGMPDIDGYMLMRQIRSLSPEQGGQIPAIALTAYAGDFNQQQALAAGFQQHISKPVEPNDLLMAIASLINASLINEPPLGKAL